MNKVNLELTTDIITDSNHPMRRFFRCWIDGSYLGQGHYQNNCEQVRGDYESDKSIAINQWCEYLAHDNHCSPVTVQRHMVKHFNKAQLAELNTELIDDLRDLVRDEMECGE